MKKIIFLLAMTLMGLYAQAQLVGYQGHVDEYDIQGRWVVSSFEGWLIQIDREFEYISFSGNQPGRLLMKTGDDIFISQWYISNSNKLHVVLSDGHVLYFVITDYAKGEQDVMKLKSFDDACTIELKMDCPINHVNTPRFNENSSSSPYNLQGMKIEDPDGIYIQNGRKYIVK